MNSFFYLEEVNIYYGVKNQRITVFMQSRFLSQSKLWFCMYTLYSIIKMWGVRGEGEQRRRGESERKNCCDHGVGNTWLMVL